MTTISFTILGEAASKANSRQLVKIKGKPAFIKSDKAISFELSARYQIPHHARLMLKGDVRADIKIFYATKRPDLDESIILDVLQAKYLTLDNAKRLITKGVYLNDRQVKEKHIYHGIDKKNPRAEITIATI